jgi:protein arginine N-methyltransferase 5
MDRSQGKEVNSSFLSRAKSEIRRLLHVTKCRTDHNLCLENPEILLRGMPIRFDCTHYRTYFGCLLSARGSVGEALDEMSSMKGDFVVIDVRYKDLGRFDDLVDVRGVTSEVLGSKVVGFIHPSPQYEREDPRLFDDIMDQISWAAHVGMYAVLLDSQYVKPADISSIAGTFSRTFPPESSVTRMWIQLGMDNWSAWNHIRSAADYPSKISICLDMRKGLIMDNVPDRWMGEPVSAFIPPSDFDSSSETQRFVLNLIRMNAQPILTDSDDVRRMSNLFQGFPSLSWEDEYVAPYHDSLQLPLQPLADHMDNVVYETFELDRIKYHLYEDAIFKAIIDIEEKGETFGSISVAVVGAGRGGLIDSLIRAVTRFNRKDIRYIITAVEKNPNAYRTLMYRARDDPLWKSIQDTSTLEILHTDMRSWKSSRFYDIIVSELLGSLGDNEASPECLDFVMKYLNPTRGVSVPQKYWSSLEPVSSHKIWQSVRGVEKFETPLVVYFNNCFKPCYPLGLFEFSHHRGSPAHSNARSKSLTWDFTIDTTIHGLGGYFHAELYAGTEMSIHPPTKTPGMVSWFPAFLPFKSPVQIRSGQRLTVEIHRKVSNSKLWVEWTVVEPSVNRTNNPDGTIHSVGLE